MKKHSLLLVFILIISNLYSQGFNEYSKEWATYFGGQGTRFTNSFVHKNGDIVAIGEVTGGIYDVLNDETYYNQFSTSSSSDFLYKNSTVTSSYSNQTLIAKFNSNGELIKSVYLPFYTIVAKTDTDNNIYIAGVTVLDTIGTPNVWQSNPLTEYQNQPKKGVIIKLNSDFSINWITYVPSSNISGICLDENFNIYGVTQTRTQSGITTGNTFQPEFILETNGSTYYDNGYLFKLNNQGQLQWATYNGLTKGNAIEYSNGELITSFSRSDATQLTTYDDYYYTPNAFSSNPSLCIISKFNIGNGQRTYSTYLDNLGITRIATNENHLYFYGYGGEVLLDELISNNAYQSNFSGALDLYLGKFDQNINPIWGTYIGGTNVELIDLYHNVLIKDNSIYLVGTTSSEFNINSPNSYQNNNGGMGDLLVMKFSLNGQLIWGSYFGGNENEHFGSIAPIDDYSFYLVGGTFSTNSISTPDSYQESLNFHTSFPTSNFGNGFIAKFAPDDEVSVQESEQKYIVIYPNPTKDKLTIVGKLSKNTKIEIRNILGQIVFQTTITNSNDFHTINLGYISTGTYVLTTRSKNLSNSYHKIIIKN